MKNLFLTAIAFGLVGCTSQKTDSTTFEEEELTVPTFYSHPTAQPTPKNITHKLFASNKTYMAEQMKELQKIFSTSGVLLKHNQNRITIILPHTITFGSNQTTLATQFEPLLAAAAKTFKEYDKTKIQIIGYTDNVGPVASNKALSLRRANTVSNFLRLNGVDINRIVVDGLGPDSPLNANKTAAEREKNHRVEITLMNIQ